MEVPLGVDGALDPDTVAVPAEAAAGAAEVAMQGAGLMSGAFMAWEGALGFNTLVMLAGAAAGAAQVVMGAGLALFCIITGNLAGCAARRCYGTWCLPVGLQGCNTSCMPGVPEATTPLVLQCRLSNGAAAAAAGACVSLGALLCCLVLLTVDCVLVLVSWYFSCISHCLFRGGGFC